MSVFEGFTGRQKRSANSGLQNDAVFVDRNEKPVPYDWLLHIFGWLSGLLFFVGLVVGVLQI
jgi:hypothetical protein